MFTDLTRGAFWLLYWSAESVGLWHQFHCFSDLVYCSPHSFGGSRGVRVMYSITLSPSLLTHFLLFLLCFSWGIGKREVNVEVVRNKLDFVVTETFSFRHPDSSLRFFPLPSRRLTTAINFHYVTKKTLSFRTPLEPCWIRTIHRRFAVMLLPLSSSQTYYYFPLRSYPFASLKYVNITILLQSSHGVLLVIFHA